MPRKTLRAIIESGVDAYRKMEAVHTSFPSQAQPLEKLLEAKDDSELKIKILALHKNPPIGWIRGHTLGSLIKTFAVLVHDKDLSSIVNKEKNDHLKKFKEFEDYLKAVDEYLSESPGPDDAKATTLPTDEEFLLKILRENEFLTRDNKKLDEAVIGLRKRIPSPEIPSSELKKEPSTEPEIKEIKTSSETDKLLARIEELMAAAAQQERQLKEELNKKNVELLQLLEVQKLKEQQLNKKEMEVQQLTEENTKLKDENAKLKAAQPTYAGVVGRRPVLPAISLLKTPSTSSSTPTTDSDPVVSTRPSASS